MIDPPDGIQHEFRLSVSRFQLIYDVHGVGGTPVLNGSQGRQRFVDTIISSRHWSSMWHRQDDGYRRGLAPRTPPLRNTVDNNSRPMLLPVFCFVRRAAPPSIKWRVMETCFVLCPAASNVNLSTFDLLTGIVAVVLACSLLRSL